MATDCGLGKIRSGSRIDKAIVAGVLVLGGLASNIGLAQDSPSGGGAPPPPMQSNRPPMEKAFHGRGGPGGGPMGGRWWENPDIAKDINLQADQKQKMDDIFQQSRLKLIDLHASLQKQEAELEPLIASDAPDESKILGQIDKVAQARAELEKSNARMLLAMRQVLTADQWTKLKAARAARMMRGDHGPGSREPGGGPGMGPGSE